MPDLRIFLSKSRITAFEQCPRRLWLEVNRRDLIQYDASRRAVFQTGHEVGALAQQLCPGGVLIGHDDQLSLALQQTSELLFDPIRRSLFEATFSCEFRRKPAPYSEMKPAGGSELMPATHSET
jgi:hypothetical protein